MAETEWEVVIETAGSFKAEMLKGLLEAQGIPVILSQEGLGHSVYSLTVGPLASVQVLVPADLIERAQSVLNDIESGAFEEGIESEPPEGDAD